jgi:hypothetical protein
MHLLIIGIENQRTAGVLEEQLTQSKELLLD